MPVTLNAAPVSVCASQRVQRSAVTCSARPALARSSVARVSRSLTQKSVLGASPVVAGLGVQSLGRKGGQQDRSSRLVCEARRAGGNDSPGAADRLLATLPYMLPLLDGLRYSKFFFLEFPQLRVILLPLQPLMQLYFNVPFASVAAFFAVYLLLVNNPSYSRFVRFNAQQAILLDVVLILPSLLENLFRAPSGGLGLSVYISAYNTIWLFILCSFVYAVSSCALGKKVLLPLVGEGADQQVM